jgi:hypothetical protein
MLHATILEAEEARDAELKAILAEEYNLQLPNATVGATRKRPSAPAPVDPVALLPRAEAAFREARQALEQADLHKLQLGSQSSIKYPANDDDEDAQAAAQREWIREWEMRQEAEKAWWLAQFLYDRRQHKLHKVRMAACRGSACSMVALDPVSMLPGRSEGHSRMLMTDSCWNCAGMYVPRSTGSLAYP